jgi:hypothetical protein
MSLGGSSLSWAVAPGAVFSSGLLAVEAAEDEEVVEEVEAEEDVEEVVAFAEFVAGVVVVEEAEAALSAERRESRRSLGLPSVWEKVMTRSNRHVVQYEDRPHTPVVTACKPKSEMRTRAQPHANSAQAEAETDR